MMDKAIIFGQTNHLDDNLFGAVMELKESVEQQDGIESGIGFDEVLNFHSGMKAYVVASIDGKVIGVTSIFAPQPDEGELAVCVDHDYRNRGVGRSMVEMALAELARYEVEKVILLCDGNSESGKHFIAALHGEELFHEYSMILEGSGTLGSNNSVTVRQANPSDTTLMATLCSAAYGDPYEESLAFIQTCMEAVQRTGYIGSVGAIPVASCFVSSSGEGLSINTVAVDPSHQRMGVATSFLSQIIKPMAEEGRPIRLDVNSSNDRALGLYRKLGFRITSDIGYYRISLSSD